MKANLLTAVDTTAIGNRLRTAREAANLSIVSAAGQSGLSRQALWMIETGRCYPSVPALLALCRLYGLAPSYCLGWEVDSIDATA